MRWWKTIIAIISGAVSWLVFVIFQLFPLSNGHIIYLSFVHTKHTIKSTGEQCKYFVARSASQCNFFSSIRLYLSNSISIFTFLTLWFVTDRGDWFPNFKAVCGKWLNIFLITSLRVYSIFWGLISFWHFCNRNRLSTRCLTSINWKIPLDWFKSVLKLLN